MVYRVVINGYYRQLLTIKYYGRGHHTYFYYCHDNIPMYRIVTKMTITDNFKSEVTSNNCFFNIFCYFLEETSRPFLNCHGNIPMNRLVIKWLLQTPSNLNIFCHFWEETPHLLLQSPRQHSYV